MARLILTVDDSPSIRLMMQLTLTAECYEVKQTSDGVEALEFARNHKADLVLTDINMPRMDGFTFLEEFRKLPLAGGIPVVVLTAKDLTREDRQRLNGQVQRIMAKGEGTESVLKKVQELVAQCVVARAV